MAGGVRADLRPARTACDGILKGASAISGTVEADTKACITALDKAVETYMKKKEKTKASLKKLNAALDTVKTCLDKKPAPDVAGAIAAIEKARAAADATETAAVKD